MESTSEDSQSDPEGDSLRSLELALRGVEEHGLKHGAGAFHYQKENLVELTRKAASSGALYREYLEAWEAWVTGFDGYSDLRRKLSDGLVELELLVERLSSVNPDSDYWQVGRRQTESVARGVSQDLALWSSSLPVLTAFRDTPRPPVPLGLGFLLEANEQARSTRGRSTRPFWIATSGFILMAAALLTFALLAIGPLQTPYVSGPACRWIFGALFPGTLVCFYALAVWGLIDLASQANESRIIGVRRATARLRTQDARLRRTAELAS